MYNGILSYGGNQLWFEGDMRKCGCGVIAAADVLLYLKHRKPLHGVQVRYPHAPFTAPALRSKYIELNDPDISAAADGSVNNCAVMSDKPLTADKPAMLGMPSMSGAACRNVLTFDAYIKYIERIRPAFPLIPGRGMPCFMLTLCLKIYMLITRMPYRVGFGTRRLSSCIADMLAHDIPVILCIGPGVHQFMKSKAERGIMLYSRSETVCFGANSRSTSSLDNVPSDISDDAPSVHSVSEESHAAVSHHKANAACASVGTSGRLSYFTYTPTRRVRSHFVVITELSGDYVKVSSWGKPYYISMAELAHYMKCDMFGLFTNVVRICSRNSSDRF